MGYKVSCKPLFKLKAREAFHYLVGCHFPGSFSVREMFLLDSLQVQKDSLHFLYKTQICS